MASSRSSGAVVRRSVRDFAGELMIFNSIVHTVVGVTLYAGTVGGMAAQGFFNAVHDTREREAAWWFFVVGLLYLIVGLLLRWIRRQGLAAPAFLGWSLIGLAAVGLFVAPSFGWPFIAAAGVLVLVSGRAPAQQSRESSDPVQT